MRRYEFTMTTILRTDNLDLLKSDMIKMQFKKEIDLDKIINSKEILAEKTLTSDRYARTYIKLVDNSMQ